MTPRGDARKRRRRRSGGTLADLLYADKTKTPTPESEWTDLVRSIAARDQHALHALYERAKRPVFTLIMRILDDRETAEEVTADVFHDVWRRAAKFDPAGGTVLGWIMNQARSRAIDRWRFDRRKKRASPHGDSSPANASSSRSAFDAAEQSRALRDALKLLTPGERQAIELTYFSGVTYAEAARQLKQPLGTLKTRIRSGLQKLRRTLPTRREES